MKFLIAVLLLISLAIVYAEETKVLGKSIDLVQSNVKRDEIDELETCQCTDTDANGKVSTYACSQDETTKQYFCSNPALQKKRGPGGDDDDDEWNHRRPGGDHDHDDDDDEWRHNHPGYHGERPERPERPRLPNLIKNGGFEDATEFANWDRLGFRGDWRIQTRSVGPVQSFFSERDIPFPPEGTHTAMVASASGRDFVALSQVVDISQFSQCSAIKFELSFRYFYRNYASDFDITLPLPLQFFSASILRTSSVLPLHTAFLTQPGSPLSTGNQYLRHKSEFIFANGINALPLSSFRLVFAQGSNIRLRVGIDDVRVTGRCHNF